MNWNTIVTGFAVFVAIVALGIAWLPNRPQVATTAPVTAPAVTTPAPAAQAPVTVPGTTTPAPKVDVVDTTKAKDLAVACDHQIREVGVQNGRPWYVLRKRPMREGWDPQVYRFFTSAGEWVATETKCRS